jgi:hypothetical protein
MSGLLLTKYDNFNSSSASKYVYWRFFGNFLWSFLITIWGVLSVNRIINVLWERSVDDTNEYGTKPNDITKDKNHQINNSKQVKP